MAEYIEREAVKKFLHQDDFETPDERWRPESEFAQMVDAIPAADVVAVVRCKECVHYIAEDLHCRKHFRIFGPDAYCSYGERKEE